MTFSSRLGLVGIVLGMAMAGTPLGQVQAPQTPVSEEYLLLGSMNRGLVRGVNYFCRACGRFNCRRAAGEPFVVANPRDPQNFIVVVEANAFGGAPRRKPFLEDVFLLGNGRRGKVSRFRVREELAPLPRLSECPV